MHFQKLLMHLKKVTNLVDDQQEKHNKQMSQKDCELNNFIEGYRPKNARSLWTIKPRGKTKLREWQERRICNNEKANKRNANYY